MSLLPASKKSGNTIFPHYKSMGIFSDAKGQLTSQSVVRSGRISNSSEPLMHVIITCKIEKDQIKSSQEKVATPFFPLYSYLLPWKSVVGSGQISNSSKLLCMSSLPASMKWIRSRTAKKKRQQHFSHYKSMGIFSNAQGQLTPQSVVGSSRILNSSELSCKSSLPASMKRIG